MKRPSASATGQGPDGSTAPFVNRSRLIIALVAGLVALLAYALTVAPSLPTGDSGDLVSAAYVLGVAHPPGYPLYTMLLHLAMLVPIGSPALLANLVSAVLDAAAIGVVALLIYDLVARKPGEEAGPAIDRPAALAALTGALLLAFSTPFWTYSVVAEVFALNNLLAALLLLLGVWWLRRPRAWLLVAMGLLFGLGLSNQQTIVLLAPALAILVFAGLRRQGRSQGSAPLSAGRVLAEFGTAVLMVVVGLLPYLYLPIAAGRNPPVNWGDPNTLSRFVADVTRSDYGSLSLGPGIAGGSLVDQFVRLGGNLAWGFVFVGLVLAVVGFWWLIRRAPVAATALAVAFLVSGPVFIAYVNPNYLDPVTVGVVERFYILPAIPLAATAGVGAFQVLEWGRGLHLERGRQLVAIGLPAALALTVASSAVGHVATATISNNQLAVNYGEDLLRDLGPNAVLLMRSDENYTSVAYAQFVLGFRTDVAAMDVELLKLPTYVDLQRQLHPDVVIPWTAYDEGVTASLSTLVTANLASRPVYYVGAMNETNWTAGFDEVRAGLVRELVPKGQAPDAYQMMRDNIATFTQLHYPARSYPDTTWEQVIVEHYGLAAFDLAYAIQSGSSGSNLDVVEQMYQTAIRLLPDTEIPTAYKNLGLLLQQQHGDPAQIISLWTHYLRLKPDDPQAGAIRAQIQALGGSAP